MTETKNILADLTSAELEEVTKFVKEMKAKRSPKFLDSSAETKAKILEVIGNNTDKFPGIELKSGVGKWDNMGYGRLSRYWGFLNYEYMYICFDDVNDDKTMKWSIMHGDHGRFYFDDTDSLLKAVGEVYKKLNERGGYTPVKAYNKNKKE